MIEYGSSPGSSPFNASSDPRSRNTAADRGLTWRDLEVTCPSPDVHQQQNLLQRKMSKDRTKAATDLKKWRLVNERGRQTWFYDEDNSFERDSNFIEKHSLGLDTVVHRLVLTASK